MELGPNHELRGLVDAIIAYYWERNWPTIARHAITTEKLAYQSCSPAGAYIELPKLSELAVPAVRPHLILTGLWIKFDGSALVDALLYVENGMISMVELAAPLDDFPVAFRSFDLQQDPKETRQIE